MTDAVAVVASRAIAIVRWGVICIALSFDCDVMLCVFDR
jgi:hypothetical protein